MQLVHGGDIYSAEKEIGMSKEELLDYSANINPLGMPNGVKEALINGLESCACYPDPLCRALVEALSVYHDVEPEAIICGNGAADLIFRLLYARKPKRALVLAPTFAEYALAMEAVGCKCEEYALNEKNGFLLTEGILDAIDETIEMVFICNPNNPTGVVTSKEMMEKILGKCEKVGAILVIDECFNEFIDEAEAASMIDMLMNSKKLFILKAFTKMYAVAGLRLGYGLCSDQQLMKQITACAQAWSVSTLAQLAGIAALKETAYVAKTRALIKDQRLYLRQSLESLGMKVYASEANYIFFRNETGLNLKEKMKKYGILIRSCANYTGLDERYYRIAVKGAVDNQRFVACLEEILR